MPRGIWIRTKEQLNKLKKYQFKKGCPPNKTSFKKRMTPWNKGLKGYMAREKNNNWRGGKTINDAGYIFIRHPNHPFNHNGYVRRSRLVMEKKLGRYLKPTEVVHHINGIKDDDRPKNLKLFTSNSAHGKFHHKFVPKLSKVSKSSVPIYSPLEFQSAS